MGTLLKPCQMYSLTLRELVLISDVSAFHASRSFGQNHAAHMIWIDFNCLQGAIFIPGIKHHITVNLLQRQAEYKFRKKQKKQNKNKSTNKQNLPLQTQRQHRMGNMSAHA